MSWAEVFKINRNMKKPLDKLNSELFYDLAKVINKGYGSYVTDEVVIIPEGSTVNSFWSNNNTVKVYIIPYTATGIGNSAFAKDANLNSVYIPEGIKTIGSYAFESCSKLKNIRLPSSIIQDGINANAFTNSSLEDIVVPWSEGTISGAPWGATNATIHYNS